VCYLPSLNDGTVEGESRLANVLELKSVIEKYDQLKGPEALTAFLAETSLLTDFDRNDPNLDAINLMTVHSAKGLEFDYVFVVGLEEGLFPHSQAFNEPDGLEEERRLFYVALTRAKRNAYLVHSRERLLFGQRNTAIPSSFINDIPEHLLNRHQTERPAFDTTAIWRTPAGSTKFRAGDKVSHTKFGNGIVVRIKDDIADIAFAKNGLRQIQTDNPSLQKYS
jgi:DNA helicase-2/ATP-dependent DNA helicase PcrA